MKDRELLVRQPPHKTADHTGDDKGASANTSMVTHRCPPGINNRIVAVPLPQVPTGDDEDEQHDAEQRPKAVSQVLQKLGSGHRPEGTIE